MNIRTFEAMDLQKMWRPSPTASKFDGGQITIIGGSTLFHGAPLFSLKAASRMVDMVYFSSIEDHKGIAEQIKASLGSFIWVPREDVEYYVGKSDAVLIGPGLMRYSAQATHHADMMCDDEGRLTRDTTMKLLQKFPEVHWVIDGGSLQVMKASEIPAGAVVTPNRREFHMLFGVELNFDDLDNVVKLAAQKANEYKCIVVAKGPTTVVTDGEQTVLVEGGNSGLTKGGTGDLMAGLTVAFRAKNDPVISAAAANFLIKKAAEKLADTRGLMYNTDDVVNMVPQVWKELAL